VSAGALARVALGAPGAETDQTAALRLAVQHLCCANPALAKGSGSAFSYG